MARGSDDTAKPHRTRSLPGRRLAQDGHQIAVQGQHHVVQRVLHRPTRLLWDHDPSTSPLVAGYLRDSAPHTAPIVDGPSPEVDVHFTAGGNVAHRAAAHPARRHFGAPVLVGSALDMQGNEIINAPDPTTPQSLVTKGYTDRVVERGIAGHVGLLTEAAWWVDAAELTAAGDGLRDLSGNGRDAHVR